MGEAVFTSYPCHHEVLGHLSLPLQRVPRPRVPADLLLRAHLVPALPPSPYIRREPATTLPHSWRRRHLLRTNLSRPRSLRGLLRDGEPRQCGGTRWSRQQAAPCQNLLSRGAVEVSPSLEASQPVLKEDDEQDEEDDEQIIEEDQVEDTEEDESDNVEEEKLEDVEEDMVEEEAVTEVAVVEDDGSQETENNLDTEN